MTTGTHGLATNLVQGSTAAAMTASPPPAPFSPLPLQKVSAVQGLFVTAVALPAAAFNAAAEITDAAKRRSAAAADVDAIADNIAVAQRRLAAAAPPADSAPNNSAAAGRRTAADAVADNAVVGQRRAASCCRSSRWCCWQYRCS